MIDTNVLLSALVFKSTRLADLIEHIVENHTLVLCSFVIDEASRVISRKSSQYLEAFDSFLLKLSFEMVYSPKQFPPMPALRDENDRPVLVSAISADVDILISGDKDFSGVDIERPEVLTPSEYFELYVA